MGSYGKNGFKTLLPPQFINQHNDTFVDLFQLSSQKIFVKF